MLLRLRMCRAVPGLSRVPYKHHQTPLCKRVDFHAVKEHQLTHAVQVLSRKLGRSPQDIIKLDANENPYGPPAEVKAALASMPFPHIYPDPECRALRAKLAELNSTPAHNLLVCF
jgi:histidinol-phosphate/aromatic aminotransferase/cobyric acid decarboxylase-like protein